MHSIEEYNVLMLFMRDTFSSCIKACCSEVNNKCYLVFKKSQKGLCYVYEEDGILKYKNEYTSENIPEGNLHETVFKDGKITKNYT